MASHRIDGQPVLRGVGLFAGEFHDVPMLVDATAAGSIAQIPGEFVMYGATVNGVSAYTLIGSYASNRLTHVTLTFTPSLANPVLAFSAHLA